jgi:hypothetical protein
VRRPATRTRPQSETARQGSVVLLRQR